MFRKSLRAALFGMAAIYGITGAANAEDVSTVQSHEHDAVFLVASPEFIDPNYAQTVLIAVPIGDGRHLGVVINRPSNLSLSRLFPDHAPSKQVVDPVHMGGPNRQTALLAVIRSDVNPGAGSIKLMGNLFLSGQAATIDRIIETAPNEARYYAGFVSWAPGELRAEVLRGAWYVLEADPKTIFRGDMRNVWGELVRLARSLRADLHEGSIAIAVNLAR